MLARQKYEFYQLLAQAASAKGQGRNPQYLLGKNKSGYLKGFDLFIKTYEPRYHKRELCLQNYREELIAFFNSSAWHWQSIRTSSPIESSFAKIQHCTKRSKGCLSRGRMLYMMSKLGQFFKQNRGDYRPLYMGLFFCAVEVLDRLAYEIYHNAQINF